MGAGLFKGFHRSERMEVLPRGPLRRWASRVGVVLLCAALLIAGYLIGLRQAGSDSAKLAALEARSRSLGQEVEALQRRLVEERLASEVNERGRFELQTKINSQRGEILDLREKVALYEALLSSDPESDPDPAGGRPSCC